MYAHNILWLATQLIVHPCILHANDEVLLLILLLGHVQAEVAVRRLVAVNLAEQLGHLVLDVGKICLGLQMLQIQKLGQRLNDIAGHLNVVRVHRQHLVCAVVQRYVALVVQTKHVHTKVADVIVGLGLDVVRQKEILCRFMYFFERLLQCLIYHLPG